jgi:hypothetical protein
MRGSEIRYLSDLPLEARLARLHRKTTGRIALSRSMNQIEVCTLAKDKCVIIAFVSLSPNATFDSDGAIASDSIAVLP